MVDRWDVAYIEGRTTKRFSYKRKGVYLIRDKFTKEIVYIGMSVSNLSKTLYRHFQKWNPDRTYRHYRVAYGNKLDYEVRVIICDTGEQTLMLEERLIRRLKPRDNVKYCCEEQVCNTVPF